MTMVDAKTIYESSDYGWYDYDPMINAFGCVAVRVDDRDYQGDTRVLYDSNGRIGHLIFGWGSCSGGDALQACCSIEELQELCNSLESSIEWFKTPQAALDWFLTRDWCGDYCWQAVETREYLTKAIEYLRKKVEVDDADD